MQRSKIYPTEAYILEAAFSRQSASQDHIDDNDFYNRVAGVRHHFVPGQRIVIEARATQDWYEASETPTNLRIAHQLLDISLEQFEDGVAGIPELWQNQTQNQ